MLSFCDSVTNRSKGLNRREWLRLGGLAGLSWALPGFLPASLLPPSHAAESSASAVPGFGRAKSVIIVFASGGQSQIDTWDPKPDAPAEIRGAFSSIATSVPGLRFCEHMPLLADIADKLCVVRNMSHEDLDHGSAFYLAHTGRYHRRRSANPLPSPDDFPCYGSVLQRVRPSTDFVTTSVHLNGPAEVPNIIAAGQFGGFLGKGYDPLTLGDVTQGNVAIPSLLPHADVPPIRLHARQSLLRSVEAAVADMNTDKAALEKNALYAQAFQMLSKQETRTAFDLSAEPAVVRNRYGRGRAGQACLLARRLVEAGVPLINVIWSHNNRGQDHFPDDTDQYGWDTHNDIFAGLQQHLLPPFDQGLSALIEDLDQRGLLNDTLVICMGEFGRAPLVALEKNFAGSSPGRKHWSWVYSIAMAGAGVTGGSVVGASDSRGAYPAVDPYGPWDVMATVFSALGIDPHQEYRDPLNRPFRVCEGKVMEAIYR
ncbi:MAG: DUF1501 domain-containing protein [Planctomycetaceae bacterium]